MGNWPGMTAGWSRARSRTFVAAPQGVSVPVARNVRKPLKLCASRASPCRVKLSSGGAPNRSVSKVSTSRRACCATSPARVARSGWADFHSRRAEALVSVPLSRSLAPACPVG